LIIDKGVNLSALKDGYIYEEPDFFVDDKKTKSPAYVKWVMDYFANVAFTQYQVNRKTFARNYDLMKGILNIEDFYEDVPETRGLLDDLLESETLPKYVKNYSILTAPINTLVGELSKLPDSRRVRAFDNFSKNEELEFYTNRLQEYVLNEAYKKILLKLQMSGADLSEIDPDQLQQQAYKDVVEEITDFTSEAEIWGNATIEALKAELDLKDKFEDAYRDLLISNRWATHTYQDGSRRGFNTEVVNPKNLIIKKAADQKYLDKAYMLGIIRVMEISEIIERFPDLTKKEIDYLRNKKGKDTLPGRSNLFSSETGSTTIKYDTYSPLIEQEKFFMEAELNGDGNTDDLLGMIGLTPTTTYNNRFTVLEVYYQGKKRIGKLTYKDQDGNPQDILVDENYVEGSPNEISIEWGWINQKYKGRKIGDCVYNLEPYTFTDSMPIVGVEHEIKNTTSISLLDMAKPFQILYNVCMNQLFTLIKNEKGRVMPLTLRSVPRMKDGDAQDDLDIWEEEAKRSGIVFIEDSPESRNQQMQFQSIDLTKTAEIQSRYNLAVQLKRECMELLGFTDARLGSVAATTTAQGIQTSLSQSYAQTAPIVAQHEVVVNKTYQVLLEAAQAMESGNESTTMTYLNDQGMSAFINIAGDSIRLRDLHVLPISSSKDSELMMKLQGLAQEMIQNGADIHTIAQLYSSNSIRQWQKATKLLADHQEQIRQEQMAQQQQEIQAQQQNVQMQIQAEQQQAAIKMQNDNEQNEKDRQVKLVLGQMQAASFNNSPSLDADNNGVYDVFELNKVNAQINKDVAAQNIAQQQVSVKREEIAAKTELGRKKLAVDLKNQANDLAVAKQNAANRSNKTPKNK